jgi:hypothetical protein
MSQFLRVFLVWTAVFFIVVGVFFGTGASDAWAGGYFCTGCDRNCGGAGPGCWAGGCDAAYGCILCVCSGTTWCSC